MKRVSMLSSLPYYTFKRLCECLEYMYVIENCVEPRICSNVIYLTKLFLPIFLYNLCAIYLFYYHMSIPALENYVTYILIKLHKENVCILPNGLLEPKVYLWLPSKRMDIMMIHLDNHIECADVSLFSMIYLCFSELMLWNNFLNIEELKNYKLQ